MHTYTTHDGGTYYLTSFVSYVSLFRALGIWGSLYIPATRMLQDK